MDLKTKVSNLPNKPGCYLYLNKDKHIIYVGKAKNLKKRVSSYFDRAQNLKTTRLVREIVDLEYFVVSNEKESLLLEENLIKKYRPKYNVLLNDDKAYPYIIITNEKNPTYRYVRKLDKKALRSFGPLPIGSNARETLITLQRLFPLRRCKGDLKNPCLHYFIGQCSGACFKEVDKEYYQEQIKRVDNFFKGNINEVKNILTTQMKKAAENLQFEEAQRIKEQIISLDFATTKQNVEFKSQTDVDVISYFIEDEKIAIVNLFYRAGKLLFKDEHTQLYFEQDITDLIDSFMNQIYDKNILPNKIIVDKEIELFDLNDKYKKITTHPIKEDEKIIYQIALENAKETIRKSKISTTTNVGNENEILSELQVLAKLNKEPYRIEMFDISNIGNEFIVGSCIVYINGKPVRNEFRKYNIESKFTSDYDRMKEMLYRRFQKALMEKRMLPDLIIMDGGIIQIHAAKEICSALALNQIQIIGLVKDEYHRTSMMLDVNEQQVEIKKYPKLFNWLSSLQIRVDEYAKSGFRKKQNNSFLKSELEQVESLGKKRIQDLFKQYNTISEIEAASDEALFKILKNKNALDNLKNYLKNRK
ncbi:excinuclease ABC subunit C [Mesoplasma chauliocola]|uniref:UvrABC system protein C n=1 Tax=Mesoplasma chauliocola TaxID=216427 RepID=A0A249SMX6_9MOLU|nr:excinuclease ABC subunit UvrC [Mesoplasma chauliocola]ASZ08861.1 excinuclease ABC subunit C [Mesoplasma chauliocola]